MATLNCLCQDASTCPNHPSAICLHCNRRLCVTHIAEHNRLMMTSTDQLTRELDATARYINHEYEMSRCVHHDILAAINTWRARQLEKIMQVYETHVQTVETRQETAGKVHQQVCELLDREARQPLQRMKAHQNGSEATLEHVRQTIKKAQQQCEQLKWNVLGIPSVPTEDIPIDSQPVSSTSDAVAGRKQRLVLSLSSLHNVRLRKFRSRKQLVDLFGNVSAIEQSKQEIEVYIKQQSGLPLPIVIASYLLAWYHNPNPNEKTLILNEHLPTVMKHISGSVNDFTILLGIHAFFFNERVEGNKRLLMTFVLQFFVSHKCLSHSQIIYWYHNKDENTYKGFDGAKQMTAPFIQSLCNPKSDTPVQTTATQPQIPVDRKLSFPALPSSFR